ncbi:hypothetical protein HMPREF0591_1830 [Mycobacterium parascrofulaceum ATCC BAA-614]|uniref:Uncharacterized protein n=1 Tax=Mycobacterium parascrofulaceum ATCC BAA-614 TaxID=525368 RepID=D5P6N6_9MYCO|nr:hypothetical protein HMPREF0591_1830 [Mycobacterium parascrofulaceum ATCC BAA-614]
MIDRDSVTEYLESQAGPPRPGCVIFVPIPTIRPSERDCRDRLND